MRIHFTTIKNTFYTFSPLIITFFNNMSPNNCLEFESHWGKYYIHLSLIWKNKKYGN